jgi:pSer/pThr/pTyr-binding forkhead associated (FHA) protein
VGPGQPVRVGRTSRSDFVIASDTFLSGTHFSVEVAGNTALLRDLRSVNGVYLNGVRVQDAELHPGDQIQGGSSQFLVEFEEADTGSALTPQAGEVAEDGPGHTQRIPLPLEDPSGLTPLQSRVVEFLSAQNAPLFALLDAAQDERVLDLLRRGGQEFDGLYEGKSAEELANFAPYLAHLAPDCKLLRHLVLGGWDKNWAVYLTSAQPLAEVRKHFRRFLMVDTESGKKLYFRFYDPRVLRSFLPRFTPEQTAEFFGPVQSYLVPGEDPSAGWRYTLGEQGVQLEKKPLAPVAR